MVNFNDISTYKKLKQEMSNHQLFKQLHTTVHHEMLAPLRSIVDVCERLMRIVSCKETKELVQIIFIASQMVLMHANDLLDQRIIENGSFVPNITSSSIKEALEEMV